MKNWFKSLLLLLLTTIFFVSCGKNEETIKIGVIIPETGTIASFGQYIKNGLSIAQSEINQEGGIAGKQVRFLFEDEGPGINAAVNAFRKLVDVDNIKIIIGPATSNGVMAIAPLANKEKVIIISPSATTDNITHAGEYIFRTRAKASDEVKAFVSYIINEMEIKTFSALRSSADYAVSFIEACKSEIEKQNHVFLTEEAFSPNTSDYRSQLTKIKNLNPEGVFIVGVPIELGNMMKQIRQLGIKSKVFSNQVDNPEIFDFAGDAANGLIFSTTFYDPANGNKTQQKFEEKYEKRFGNTSHLFAANAYDALYAIKKAIEKGEDVKNNLYNLPSFKGASGIIQFDENGDLKLPKIAIKMIKDGKFEFIKEVTK